MPEKVLNNKKHGMAFLFLFLLLYLQASAGSSSSLRPFGGSCRLPLGCGFCS